jgi:sugar lactone lactonase YvrE
VLRCALTALVLLGVSACGAAEETAAETHSPASIQVGTVEDFAELPGSSEGLAMGLDATGADTLYVGSAGGLHRVSPSGELTEVASGLGPVGVTARGSEILVCGKDQGAGVIWSVSAAGDKQVLVGSGALTFEVVNFLVVAPDGSLVFSDSKANKVYRTDADGKNVELVTDAITYPNGMAFSEDGKTLYVASWDSAKIYAIPFDGSGHYKAPEVFAEGPKNVDGLVSLEGGDLLLVQSGVGVVRYGAKDGSTTSLADAENFGLSANGAFGRGAYGEAWLYVTDLLTRSLKRVYLGERGVDL